MTPLDSKTDTNCSAITTAQYCSRYVHVARNPTTEALKSGFLAPRVTSKSYGAVPVKGNLGE
jgi:hypothetical protein